MKLKLLVSAIMAAGIVSAPLALAADDELGGNPKIPPAAALSDCCTPGDADFPKVGGNLGNQNYSRLKAINKDNIGQLGAVWLNRIEGGINTGTNQSTTVVVDGLIYIESAFGHVYAVDGKTGLTKWKYTQLRGTLTRRGVAVAKDLGLVYTLANGNWVVALNKDTGAVVWERQHNGWGNLEKVAIVYHDKMLYIGSNDATRNAAVALDATNGDMKWHFWGWPAAGEPFYDTWGGGPQSGASNWMHAAIDPELGLVYWTFGNARGGSSQNGSARPGQNLFADSIVALDMKTGEYKWHFQSIHHDIWDMDNVMAPVLIDIKLHGRGDQGDRGRDRDEDKVRKLLVYGSKPGMYYILDRTDGSAPLGIDEVPVPVDPRQSTYPTQPIPRQGGWYCHGEKATTDRRGISDPKLHRERTAGRADSWRSEPRGSELRSGLPVRGALGRAGSDGPRPRRRR